MKTEHEGRKGGSRNAEGRKTCVTRYVPEPGSGSGPDVAARLCFSDGGIIGERDDAILPLRHRCRAPGEVEAAHWRQWRYLVTTRRRLAKLFGPVIAARRRSRGGDGVGISSYVDSLLDLRVPNNADADGESPSNRRALRDDEVVRLVWEFLGSSTEAVVACVEWALARLVTEPEVQKKLHRELIAAGDQRKGQVSDERLQDLPYLRAVILESLRLHPPLPMIVCEVRFLFNAEEIGRDAKAWTDTDPDEFRPERFLPGGEGEDVSPVPEDKEIKMMPFGAGRRHCPGAGLSMIHVGCFVAALVREFEWAPPADDGSVDLTAINALFVKVMASLLRARITARTVQSQS
ncbi:cytochrome P450 89A2-like [Panicum miliaceum]|uniref:Cytochrome P450 89A2-like n=1 Tax=Panicum miliaceum TaxID=4540 RepID=A0A3L6Q1C7_PANMI|nr:cytochrome P450 89A2-like [Panicum miliaceum]